MNAQNPDDHQRAIEQIRDGKLDSMLSQMFGSDEDSESDDDSQSADQPRRLGLNGSGNKSPSRALRSRRSWASIPYGSSQRHSVNSLSKLSQKSQSTLPHSQNYISISVT